MSNRCPGTRHNETSSSQLHRKMTRPICRSKQRVLSAAKVITDNDYWFRKDYSRSERTGTNTIARIMFRQLSIFAETARNDRTGNGVGYFRMLWDLACRDRDTMIIKRGILKYECRELKCNLYVSEKKVPRLAEFIFITGRRGMGLQPSLGPVMVSASMHDTIIECFRYYYIGCSITVETLDRNQMREAASLASSLLYLKYLTIGDSYCSNQIFREPYLS